jgi:dinuclear metal center YbgI/SA1388 family protein
MAVATAELIAYLDELLEAHSFADYGPNGLQVPGADAVEKIVTGVSAQLELFEQAAARDAQLVLAHHGILWDGQPLRIGQAQARRLRALLANHIALAAYHLPLDAHPEIGNNALIAERLGCVERAPFGTARGRPIGIRGRFEGEGIEPGELRSRIAAAMQRDPLFFEFGPARVQTIGIVSGSAAGSLGEAIAEGLDAFVTGEPAERVMADAREGAIHFAAAGHYATETFGIRRLGELAAERFGLDHEFVDIPNPI